MPNSSSTTIPTVTTTATTTTTTITTAAPLEAARICQSIAQPVPLLDQELEQKQAADLFALPTPPSEKEYLLQLIEYALQSPSQESTLGCHDVALPPPIVSSTTKTTTTTTAAATVTSPLQPQVAHPDLVTLPLAGSLIQPRVDSDSWSNSQDLFSTPTPPQPTCRQCEQVLSPPIAHSSPSSPIAISPLSLESIEIAAQLSDALERQRGYRLCTSSPISKQHDAINAVAAPSSKIRTHATRNRVLQQSALGNGSATVAERFYNGLSTRVTSVVPQGQVRCFKR